VQIAGTVRSVSKRGEPIRLEIWVNKKGEQRFLNQEGMRVPVPLSIGSQEYTGGIRFTRRNTYIWICPDLMVKGGGKTSLANALKAAGISKNDGVLIRVEKWKISIVATNLSPQSTQTEGH